MNAPTPTSLPQAIAVGDVHGARALLTAGADCNVRDRDDLSLLMLAAQGGDLAMVKLLLEFGADANARDKRGWGPLAKAIYNTELERGFPDVVRALVEAGANIEAPIGYGVRPLMLAAGYGETPTVEILLEAGADVTAKNEGGLTALMMVKEKFYVDVINLLYEAEREAGVGEGSCSSKHPPGSTVVTFRKPGAKT